MKFDYISDLHVTDKNLDIIDIILLSKKSDYIFISGDVSEELSVLILVLTKFSEKYKKVFYIPGNHELLFPFKLSFTAKYERVINTANLIPNVIAFDGQVIDIEGIKISGLTMWYDGSYMRKKYYFLPEYEFRSTINKLYRSFMIDSRYLERDMFKMFDFFMEKFNKIDGDIDIMFSHISPFIEERFLSPRFKKQDSNAFFCFNGRNSMRDKNIKKWIFGHTHDRVSGNIRGVDFYCNPYGYTNENKSENLGIMTFEYNGDKNESEN